MKVNKRSLTDSIAGVWGTDRLDTMCALYVRARSANMDTGEVLFDSYELATLEQATSWSYIAIRDMSWDVLYDLTDEINDALPKWLDYYGADSLDYKVLKETADKIVWINSVGDILNAKAKELFKWCRWRTLEGRYIEDLQLYGMYAMLRNSYISSMLTDCFGAESVNAVKTRVRARVREMPSERIVSSSDSSVVYLQEMPIDPDASYEDAEDYFEENVRIPTYASDYDCTGRDFTQWHWTVFRNGKWMVYHSVGMDV